MIIDEKKLEKFCSAEDIIKAMIVVYAEHIPPKNGTSVNRDFIAGAGYALGALGGFLLGKDYEERLKDIPNEAKKHLEQKTTGNNLSEDNHE